MSERKLSETAVVRQLADHVAHGLTRRTIAALQGMTDHLNSGEDSGLKSVWDEICVQVQGEESVVWDAYEQTVRALLTAEVAELPAHEREALWLQTEPALDWNWEEADARAAYPVNPEDVVEHLWREYLLPEAGRWSNARIRAFQDRCWFD